MCVTATCCAKKKWRCWLLAPRQKASRGEGGIEPLNKRGVPRRRRGFPLPTASPTQEGKRPKKLSCRSCCGKPVNGRLRRKGGASTTHFRIICPPLPLCNSVSACSAQQSLVSVQAANEFGQNILRTFYRPPPPLSHRWFVVCSRSGTSLSFYDEFRSPPLVMTWGLRALVTLHETRPFWPESVGPPGPMPCCVACTARNMTGRQAASGSMWLGVYGCAGGHDSGLSCSMMVDGPQEMLHVAAGCWRSAYVALWARQGSIRVAVYQRKRSGYPPPPCPPRPK